MIEFYGACPHCSYFWEVLNRMPNHCPECGRRLFNSNEEMIEAKKQQRPLVIVVQGLEDTIEGRVV